MIAKPRIPAPTDQYSSTVVEEVKLPMNFDTIIRVLATMMGVWGIDIQKDPPQMNPP